MDNTVVNCMNKMFSSFSPTKMIDEPTNYDYELDNLLEDYGFQRELIGKEDYLIYKHPKTKIRVEYSKGSLIEVDTLDEVKQILAKHKIIK